MSEPVHFYCDGYVIAPLVAAFRRRGLFELLDTQDFQQRADLIRQTCANPRLFDVGLRALLSMGWLEQGNKEGYRLARRADVERFRPDLATLYSIEPARMLHEPACSGILVESIDAALSAAPAGSWAEGAFVIPVMQALSASEGDDFSSALDELDSELAKRIRRLFGSRGWLQANRTKLTRTGRRLLEADEFSWVAAYRPLLDRIDAMMFGDSAACLQDLHAELSRDGRQVHEIGDESPAEIVKQFPGGRLPGHSVLYSRSCLDPARGAVCSEPSAGWEGYFQSWARHIHDSSVLLVQDHGVQVPDVTAPRVGAREPQRLYRQTLHDLFGRRHSSAEQLIMQAAATGLFNRECVKRYPITGGDCGISVHQLVSRDYIIREATQDDLPRLCELEQLCWRHTRTPKSRILARVQEYPQGQLVLEKHGRVLGVVYSQRIAGVEALHRRNAGNVHRLHDPSGSIVQLLALNVDPAAQNLNLGDQLLEFMLQRCSLMSGVARVVGVTLCKQYDASGATCFEEYIRRQGDEQDPVLAFHQAHGAMIVGPVAKYRREDDANEGYGVLVSYDIHNRFPQRSSQHAGAGEQGAARAASAGESEQIAAFLTEQVSRLLGEHDSGFAVDRPLMELGLDSADLLKLQRQLELQYHRTLQPAFFFQYNTVAKVVSYLSDAPAPAAPRSDLSSASQAHMDIAVVGMSCKLPGGIETPEELWQALASKRSMIGPYPRARGRWPNASQMPGIEMGGFVADVDAFDSTFFRIPPRDARIIDPQQRILMELAWTCLEDAAIVPATLQGTNTGVFIGASNADYARLMQQAGLPAEAHHATGNSLAVLANRISYFFDFSGPSLLIDTACSASLVALHYAIQSLRTSECGAALVGGVNVICHPDLSIAYHKAGMLAPDGKCKVFDATANGYVRAEGAVMLLLKPLATAIASGDRIHAVIKASAVNHGGLAGGLTVPNPQKQAELLTTAWKSAGLSPRDLGYLEAHGTGTSLGDPIEIQGITTAFEQLQPRIEGKTCAIGSVKSNLGHLESAAGLAGLMKVILALRHQQIPGNIHFEQLNPKILLEDTPFYIASEHAQWHSTKPRVAGVSSFGSGGANAHVVVQEYATQNQRPAPHAESYLFVLSAGDRERLQDYATRVVGWLEQPGSDQEFPAAIHTWQTGRTAMKHRLAMVVSGAQDLRRDLQQWLANEGSAAPLDAAMDVSSSVAAIDAALSERNLHRLGQLWMSGADIDWRRLHERAEFERGRPGSIRVPTYPFSRQRHWIDTAEAQPGEVSSPLFFEERWQEAQPGAIPDLANEAQRIVFADRELRDRVLGSDDAGDFARAVFVEQGDSAADFQQTLDSVATGHGALEIIYSWAKGRGEEGVHQLFDVFKSVKQSRQRITRVTLVGHYDPDSVQSCWDYSWIGFQRSLRLVLPHVRVSLLLIGDNNCTARQLLDASRSEGVIRYRGDQRLVLAIEQRTLQETTQTSVLRNNGGYLITGGCGALGFSLARYLARECRAKLLLIGRSPRSARIEEQLDTLRRAGAAEVHYHAVDISDRRSVLAWAQGLPFSIRGVIHAAGTQSLQPFHEKSTSEINAVLHPKTRGTLMLDEALAEQPLDFTCYFSSSSAMLGDFGACDYSIANRFQMAYAAYRNGAGRYPGRTLVINWPLWEQGGIRIGDAAQTALYLKSSGQESLQTELGLDLWHRLLHADRLQTLVMVGQADRVQHLLNRRDNSTTSMRDRVLADIRQLAAACLGTSKQSLDDATNLADYGFDSIHLTDFSRRLTAHFGMEVTPVIFFSYTTVQQLSDHFITEHAAHLHSFYVSSASTPSPAINPGIASADEMKQRVTHAEAIAVVGMSGQFPQARTVNEFWNLLAQGRSAIGEIPPSRWNWRDYFVAPGHPANRISTNQGGFIDGVDEFDPLFFEISPREAEEMDPAERLVLMEAYRAIEDAGWSPAALAGANTGVFVGMEEGQYDSIIGRQGITTSGCAMVSSRLSYFLDLHGPAIATNTACSSGLVALHQAMMSLRQGECETALVAGVSLSLAPASYVMMSQAGMLSPDGQCHSFAKNANGIGVGEAVVVLVLKPLAAAVAAGDNIHGVVTASGINFDGKTNGVTAPNGRMQSELIENVYRANQIDVSQITHIVAHGTGTPLGDPVEITALSQAFKKLQGERTNSQQVSHCAVTSCKSNVGHTLAASGLVSVVGLLQGMRHRQIPPTLSCEEQTQYIAWENSPFYLNKSLREWQTRDGKPRAGAVSAFGRSGTNAHVVLEEYPRPVDVSQPEPAPAPAVILLSAQTPEQRRRRAEDLLSFIEYEAAAGRAIDLRAMAYTLQVGRQPMKERVGFVVRSVAELGEQLRAHSEGRQHFTDPWIAQNELSKLLEAWVSGSDVDWSRLYSDPKPRRISLPAYPFARKSYWASAEETPPSTLHPLLQRNTSDLSGQRYTSAFSGAEFFLKDHRVLGDSVLPGVAYLEMVRAAVEQAVPARSKFGTLELHDTVWIQPFVARPGRQISITLSEDGADESRAAGISYEVHSHEGSEEDGSEVVHCQGRAVLLAEGAPATLDLAMLERQTPLDTVQPSSLYDVYRKSGLDYGPAFQAVRSIRQGEGQLLVRLSLPSGSQPLEHGFSLHPSLLDGALQSAIALSGLEQSSGAPSLPFELSLLRVMRACAGEMYAWVRYSQDGRSKQRGRLDIDLCDGGGNVCVQMRGFAFRTLGGARGADQITTAPRARAEEGNAGVSSLIPIWSAASLRAQTNIADSELPRVLLVGGERAQLDWMLASYPRGEQLNLPADANVDLIRDSLRGRTFDHLVWIAPDVMKSTDEQEQGESTIAAQAHGLLAVFRVAKALLALGYAARELQWTLITRHTQPVSDRDPVVPTHAGLSGLIGSLAKEYPHWKLRLLDIDDPTRVRAADCVSLTWDPQDNCYAHRRGEWFRQELARLTGTTETLPVYKQRGVYVIIGGAGGLGEVWSRHLIDQYRARIVWIGRRELDAVIQSKIDSLEESGSAPLYISADATDLDSLQQALETILGVYPRIDGVVHSALVLKDQTFMAMEESRFQEAIRAKVDISVNLDRVFGGLDLDFMLFFSSLMSFLKAPGQCNYAAGCTFKDSFAHSLRGRRTHAVKIMNWGYWGSIGVVADDFYRRRMEQTGLGSIEPQAGWPALQTLLGSDIAQMAFYKSLDDKTPAGLDISHVLRRLPEVTAPDPRRLQQALETSAVVKRTADVEDAQLPEQINVLAAEILAATLNALGLFDHAKERHAKGSSAKPAPFYDRWLERSLRYLQQERPGTASRPRTLDVLWREWEHQKPTWLSAADLAAYVQLLDVCLHALPDVLSGRRPVTEVMFPASSMQLVEGVYKGNAASDYYNKVLGEALAAYIAELQRVNNGAQIRILEVGAGTGGTTAMLLPGLRAFGDTMAEYCYTDISKAFLLHAEQHYQSLLPSLTTAIFDVSKPVATQAVTAERYDVVIATNVLHATADVRGALRNVKSLLKYGGVLLLNELSTWTLFHHLTFGLLPGWWLYRDGALRLPGSPVLAPETWERILADEGFSSVVFAAPSAHRFGQQVIVASSDGVIRQPVAALPQIAVEAESSAHVTVAQSNPADVPWRSQGIAWFRKLIATSLKMSPEEVNADEPLERYGLDSILVVHLTNQLRATLPDITSTLFFEVQSVAGLVDYLLEHRFEGLQRLVATAAADESKSRHVAGAVGGAAVPAPRLLDNRSRVSRRSRPDISHAADEGHARRGIFDVAIVGCSGRYPESPDLRQFWSNLANGVNCVSEIPADRWQWQQYFDAEKGKEGKIYSRWGGFLRDIDKFDPLFFRISPKEAKGMDPQERLFLECCYHAIEDAGYTPESLGDPDKIGVFVGVMNARYNAQPLYYSVANRVSYLFNFQGPSMAVDTACSSSLSAIHLALESLYGGLSECVIAGGVNLVIDAAHYQELSALTMLSAGNQCRAFGDSADGFVDAEGVGAIVLKPLWMAERDGDHIYGVIKASAVNAGGKTNGYTVPNPKAQARVVSKALQRAGIEAQDVSYIEAHGTGTALGDPIEIAALTRAFRESTDARQFCAIGSLKSNIGHCESAAGIAGLTKVLLQLKHAMLVPSLHCEATNPEIDFGSTPFQLQRTAQPWRRPVREVAGVMREFPRTAGISSFGAGGSNAHIIVQEYVSTEPKVAVGLPRVIVPLSARTSDQLQQKARELLQFIRTSALDGQSLDLTAMAHTLQVGRESLEERLAFVTSSVERLQRQLASFAERAQEIEGSYRGQVKRHQETLPGSEGEAASNLEQVAALWVKGLKVDWRRLYGEARPGRISLPVYPFAKERYWKERGPQLVEAAHLHPLLHRNVSDLRQQRYSSTFIGNEPGLSDVRVVMDNNAERHVFPAMVYLEMARAALENATSHQRSSGVEFYNVAWADPLAITASMPLAVALFATGSEQLAFEIYSPSQTAAGEIVHCQGRALLARELTPATVEIERVKSHMRLGRVDPAAQYAIFAELGVHYGPSARCMRALYKGEGQLLAELRLPDAWVTSATRTEELILHPAMMDGALQAASTLILTANPPSLPVALESLRVIGACSREMFVWVRRCADAGPAPTHVQLDVDLCDRLGNVCVQMRGLTYEQQASFATTQLVEPIRSAAQSAVSPQPATAKPNAIALTAAG